MRGALAASIVLAAGVLTASGGAHALDDLRSPLMVRNAEPLNTLFLQAMPAPASTLPKNHSRITVSLDVVNHLLYDRAGISRFEQDMEIQRLSLHWVHGAGNDWEVVAHASIVARDGGALDELINIWHRWFGLYGGGRASHRNYVVHHRIVREGRTLVDTDSPALGLGDTTLEVRRRLGQAGRSYWAGRLMLKLPTGNAGEQFGSGSADFGAGIMLSYQSCSRLICHVNLSKVWAGRPTRLDATARDMVQWLLGVEYIVDARTSLVMQIDGNRTPVVVGVPYADGDRRSLTIGLVRDLGSGRRLEVSITENQFGWLARIAPDFHLRAALSWVEGALKLP